MVHVNENQSISWCTCYIAAGKPNQIDAKPRNEKVWLSSVNSKDTEAVADQKNHEAKGLLEESTKEIEHNLLSLNLGIFKTVNRRLYISSI